RRRGAEHVHAPQDPRDQLRRQQARVGMTMGDDVAETKRGERPGRRASAGAEAKVAPVPTTPRVRRVRSPRRGGAATEAANAGPGTDPIVRSLFAPAPGTIYLDTATYGLPPRPTVEVLERALHAWQSGLGNWIEDWDRPSDRCRNDFASLIGTEPANIAFN